MTNAAGSSQEPTATRTRGSSTAATVNNQDIVHPPSPSQERPVRSMRECLNTAQAEASLVWICARASCKSTHSAGARPTACPYCGETVLEGPFPGNPGTSTKTWTYGPGGPEPFEAVITRAAAGNPLDVAIVRALPEHERRHRWQLAQVDRRFRPVRSPRQPRITRQRRAPTRSRAPRRSASRPLAKALDPPPEPPADPATCSSARSPTHRGTL